MISDSGLTVSGMSITEDRKKEINFSIGYAELANMFVAPKTSDLAGIKDFDSLIKALDGKTPRKIIVVPQRIVNVVV